MAPSAASPPASVNAGGSRVWPVITAGTSVAVVGFWTILLGLFLGTGDEGRPATATLVAAGLAALATSVAVVALGSRPVWSWAAAGRAVALAGAAFVGGVLLFAEPAPVTATEIGLSVGAVSGLYRKPGHRITSRIVMASVAVVYVWGIVRVAPSLALLVAPVLPFPSVGLADVLSERMLARAT